MEYMVNQSAMRASTQPKPAIDSIECEGYTFAAK
jgi:hypothetical protein